MANTRGLGDVRTARLAVARNWPRNPRNDVVALWIAARDPRVPCYARLLAGVVSAYALSPIDLIPDSIPVLGRLDDALLVSAAIWLVLQMIPTALMAEFRGQAWRMDTPRSAAGAALMVTLCSAAMTWALLALVHHHRM